MSSKYFPPHKGISIVINLNLSNYATKDDLKNITHVDKLQNIPGDLTKLNNTVQNNVL